MISIESNILEKIRNTKRGVLIFPEDFSQLASSEAVRLALHRLEKDNIICRVAQGVYVRPKISKYIGQVLPTTEEIALGIAKRDKIKIVPTGVYALHALGLSTQIPMKVVWLTDGSPREIKVGKRTIKFKKTTPKNLLAKGKISSLVIQALKEIGINKQTIDEEIKIIKLLKEEDPSHLLFDISLAPVWIQKIMRKAL
jgi:predicted transcriptional regulator